MNRHPGGSGHTLRMLNAAGLCAGAHILDLGAGDGETVKLLRSRGYEAEGIDISPRGENVRTGDLLNTPFPDASFDALISQCAFYVSGDVVGAFRESFRLLRHGGKLLYSDVCFSSPENAAEAAGFRVLHAEDMTAQWREYYIEALWRGTAEYCTGHGKCAYKWLICGKD